MSNKPFIVACIPAHNEEKTVATISFRARKYVDEVIVCDDGSTDSTRKVIERLGITVKNHRKNRGKGSALKTLFEAAKDADADIIVTLDADGTHFPEEIPILLKPLLESDSDMVVGSRFITRTRGTVTATNYAGNRLFSALTVLLTGKKLTDTQSGFRAFKKKLLEDIVVTSKGYEVESEITIRTLRCGYKIIEVPIKCGRNYRASRLHSFRDGARIFTTIITTFITSMR